MAEVERVVTLYVCSNPECFTRRHPKHGSFTHLGGKEPMGAPSACYDTFQAGEYFVDDALVYESVPVEYVPKQELTQAEERLADLQEAVDRALSALHGSQYVGGLSERDAWRRVVELLGPFETQHTAANPDSSTGSR